MAIVIRKSHGRYLRPASGRGSPTDKQRQEEAAREHAANREIDERYQFLEFLGEGGSGRVIRAYDRILEMEVAVKILAPRLVSDPVALAALKEEVRISLSLTHQYIVRTHNLEKFGDIYLIVMEYLKGQPIAKYLEQYPSGLELDFVVGLVHVVASALDYAHRHGILHMGIKPGNIFLTDDGIAKVIDFGIARRVGENAVEEDDTIAATPEYVSPEQLRGDEPDCRTDIYSMGVVTTQLLTGSVVNAPGATIEDIAFKPHPPITGLPEPLLAVLEKATAFNRDERFSSMEEFSNALAAAAAPFINNQQQLRNNDG